MPVYRLNEKEISFPLPYLAEDDGLLAVGGDLSVDRLILAYSNGIFPWYNEGEPIMWWCPKERYIIRPGNVHISHSMKKFMKKHGISRYSQGSAPNPFMSKIFCGECGMPYTKHTWSDRGISQWQCRGHRVKGILRCKNAFVDVADLERGFVTAFNKLMADDNRKKEWENAIQSNSALERIRARQLLELAKQPPLTGMVNELGQLVVHEITILGAKKYAFTFMDGTKITVNA